MKKCELALAWVAFGCIAAAQQPKGSEFRLVLPDHKGQLSWIADGFTTTQSSAKPNGRELGFRGEDSTRRLSFLGFLFLVPEENTLTSAKCRDEDLVQERKDNPSLSVLQTSEISRSDRAPISLVTYSTKGRDGIAQYHVRGFVASKDICGDLEVYSSKPIRETDADVAKIFSTYRFDASYTPKFGDVVLYAQMLYEAKMFQAAAPIFEKALTMLIGDGSPFPSERIARRVVTDQAGMAYGISGNLGKAHSIFEAGIAADPEYPMYYYNLACADAGESKLSDARLHLQQAFARKANLISGETMPDPTSDDSFLPYKGNAGFWAFLEQLKESK